MYTVKICARCKAEKPIADFYQRSDRRPGQMSAWCRACYVALRSGSEGKSKVRKWRKKTSEKQNKRKRARYWADPEKARAKNRDYYIKNPHMLRKRALRKYGLTIEQFDEMLMIQRQRCMLCGGEFNTNDKRKAPTVDHDHQTGEVRGIIHGMCNAGLGFFEDDVNKLLAAIEYLRIFK